ncbi:MAG: PqqD family protein [Bdellovibrionota bacterium]
MIIHTKKGNVHELNLTGTFLWTHADGSHSLAQLAGMLCENFEVDLDQATKDVDEFFSSLEEDGLILNVNHR